jgi:DNA-binding CsgD family transcriptional regulator
MLPTAEETIGRENELAVLERFIEGATAASRALVLEGEPGIGKTTLWKAGLADAAARGFVALPCRPGELETALPYVALSDLLGDRLDEILGALPTASACALDRALADPVTDESPLDQRAVCSAFLGSLLELAKTGPVVVAIDDSQWLDRSSARVVTFALRRIRTERVALLETVRAGHRGSVAAETSFEHVERIVIEPLDERTIERLLQLRLGLSLPRPLLRELYATSGGNPLFALELGQSLERSGAPPAGTPIDMPQSARELVLDRLAGLPDEVRELVRVAAAVAQPTVDAASRIVGRRAAELALAGAVDAGLLTADRGRLRFVHPLLRSVVYADMPPEQRRKLHGRLAEIVEDADERAHHLSLATVLPDPSVAQQLDDAARRARARGAPEAAASLSTRALRLTPDSDLDAIVRRTLEAADRLLDLGDAGAARALIDGIRERVAAGPDRARLLHRLARAEAVESGFVASTALLRQAMVEPGCDTSLRAVLVRDLSVSLMHHEGPRAAIPHARAAVALAEQAGDEALTLDVRSPLEAVEFELGRGAPGDLRVRLSDPRALAQRLEDVDPGLLQTTATYGAMLKWSDDFGGARSVLEALLDHLDERVEEGMLVPVLFHLGELELWAGNWERAASHAQRCAETAVRTSHSAAWLRYLYLDALLSAYRGDADAAREQGLQGLALADELSDVRLIIRTRKTLGFLDLSLGDAAGAADQLERAVRQSAELGFVEPGIFRLDAEYLAALIALGRYEAARDHLSELESRARAVGRRSALADAARSRGILEAADGDTEAALEELRRALSHHDRLETPFERARTLLALGSVHRRCGQKRSARVALEDARSLFERLGSPLWAEKAVSEATRIGGRSTDGGDQMTPSEQRVAELVAAGRTNQEVAAELFLSVKTVEFHLRNLFRKLDVRSRTELAALLTAARSKD